MFASKKDIVSLTAEISTLKEHLSRVEALILPVKREQTFILDSAEKSTSKVRDDFNAKLGTLSQDFEKFRLSQHAINESQKVYNDFLEKKAESIKKDLADSIVAESGRLNEKINDLLKKVENMVSNYALICQKILDFNRDLFIKDFFYNATKDVSKEFEAFKQATLQPLLQQKWTIEKNKNGHSIVNNGVKIIDEHDRLHAEILQLERKGENVDKLKEQLKGLAWVISTLKS